MNIIKEAGRIFLPDLRVMSCDLLQLFPAVAINVTSIPLGANTNNKAHLFAIECLLQVERADQPDHIALIIEIDHINSSPTNNAEVIWGDPSNYTEAELFENPIPATAEALRKMQSGLTYLFEVLVSAIRRGIPTVN